MIKIKNIILRENGTKLKADIEYNNEIKELWYSTDTENGKYLCNERADSFVVALLMFAMEKNEDIVVEQTPISAKLYQNLNNTFIPTLAKAGDKYKSIKIIANTTNEQLENEGYNGTSISCGVDCFTTLSKYTSNLSPDNLKINCLTLFNMGSNGDKGGEKARELYNFRKQRARKFSEEYNFKFVEVDSNISEFINMNFFETHTLRNCSAVLAIQKMFKNYYYSSGTSVLKFKLNHYNPALYDVLTLSMISNDNVNFYSTGTQYKRIEKTEVVSDYSPSYKYLNVCVREENNCCVCEKCIRTILALQALDKLNNYKEVFDMNLIEKNRKKIEEFMLRKVEQESQDYIDIYNLMKEKGKEILVEKDYRNKKKSYELFRNKDEVKYAQETILNLNLTPLSKETKTIGITIINLELEEKLKNKKLEYEDFIKRIIIKFAKRRYDVNIFAFDENEQLEVINRVLENLPKKYIKRINIISYKNNVQEFINKYAKMEYIVATPYYSLILSALFEQKIYNLIYNERQEEMLNNLELSNNYIKISDLTYETVMNKKEFVQVNKEKKDYIKQTLEKEWKFFDRLDNIINMEREYI